MAKPNYAFEKRQKEIAKKKKKEEKRLQKAGAGNAPPQEAQPIPGSTDNAVTTGHIEQQSKSTNIKYTKENTE